MRTECEMRIVLVHPFWGSNRRKDEGVQEAAELSKQIKGWAEQRAECWDLFMVQSIADYFVMKNYFIEFLAKDKGRGIMWKQNLKIFWSI